MFKDHVVEWVQEYIEETHESTEAGEQVYTLVNEKTKKISLPLVILPHRAQLVVVRSPVYLCA
jgi:bifunctional pyridoxal-dependent enzyme with beta-cystathionase and maltose regulon repressor activities